MYRKQSTFRKLSVQSLESRQLMAGDVTAYFAEYAFGNRTDLVVEGDNQANEVRVVEDGGGGVVIEGLGGTTVNGQPIVELQGENGFIEQARFDLGNGDDALIYDRVENIFGAFQTRILTGNGDDTVELSGVALYRSLTIETGNGNDHLNIEFAHYVLRPGSLNISTGNGDDVVEFQAAPDGSMSVAPFSINSFVDLNTGHGNDLVRFTGSLFLPNTSFLIHLGNGDDQLIGDSDSSGNQMRASMFVFAEAGNDELLAASYFAPSSPFIDGFESIDGNDDSA